ncbi:MAG: PDZ domain-containing protein, partial [Acidobacteriota bacterium]
GDIVTAVDGEQIQTSHDIQKIIRAKEEGDEVEIQVYRKGRQRSLTVVVEEKEIRHFNIGRIGAITIPEIELPEIDIHLEQLEPIVIRSVERIRKLVESEEFQEQLQEFKALEKELQEKIRALEERLRELEKRLLDAEEESESL